MNLITELQPYFEKTDVLLSKQEKDLFLYTPFDKITSDIIPKEIILVHGLNLLLDCAGIKSTEAKRRFFSEIYYLYLKGCFK